MKLIITITAFLFCTIFSYAQSYYVNEAKEAVRIDSAIQLSHWDMLPGKNLLYLFACWRFTSKLREKSNILREKYKCNTIG